MKKVLTAVFCFVAVAAGAQDNGSVTEEKTSVWIKVADPVVAKPKTSSAKKNKVTTKPVTQPKPVSEEFSQTNKKVNRFGRAKKD